MCHRTRNLYRKCEITTIILNWYAKWINKKHLLKLKSFVFVQTKKNNNKSTQMSCSSPRHFEKKNIAANISIDRNFSLHNFRLFFGEVIFLCLFAQRSPAILHLFCDCFAQCTVCVNWFDPYVDHLLRLLHQCRSIFAHTCKLIAQYLYEFGAAIRVWKCMLVHWLRIYSDFLKNILFIQLLLHGPFSRIQHFMFFAQIEFMFP